MGHIFKENEIMAGAYQIIREIGRGGVGVIYLAYHLRLNKYVVIKKISSAARSSKFLRDEADIMKNLHHPGLPQVYDYIVEEDAVFTVMDYIEGTDLSNIPVGANNIPESQMVQWLRQLAEVLEYLHSRQVTIIHSDIKPQNIILRTDGTLCLIDFNISLSEGEWAKVKGVSEEFASPEQIIMADTIKARQPVSFEIDTRTDIYSLGATFYYLASGLQPNGRTPNYPLRDIKEIGYSKGLMEIIDKASSWSRDDRYINATAMIEAIDRFQRRGPHYIRRVILKSAAIALCGLVIGTGTFFIVRDRQNKIYEEYSNKFFQLTVDVESGNLMVAREAALEMLNKSSYQGIFRKKPEEKAKVEGNLADVYYNEGNFAIAGEYYKRAIADADGAGEIQDYYRGYLRSLIKEGKTAEADAVIKEASTKGLSHEEISLMQIIILAESGSYDDEKKALKELEGRTSSSEIKSIAYLDAAMAALNAGEYEDAVKWAEGSNELTETVKAARLAGETSLSIAINNLVPGSDEKQWLLRCIKNYEIIENKNSLSITDYINYTSALIEVNRSTDALTKLTACENRYGESFYIYRNKAFAYNSLGDSQRARENCNRALTLFVNLPEKEKVKSKGYKDNLEELLSSLE